VIRLAVRVHREQAEIVLAELLQLAPAGVEEVAIGEHTVEYAVYGPPGELPGLPDLNAVVGDALVQITTSEISDDWHERWKEFHRPVLIRAPAQRAVAPTEPGSEPEQRDSARRDVVPAIRVRPPWEPPGDREHDDDCVCEIVIDPGQAFGTGAHASTRMCLELLLELAAAEPARGPLLDVGTGSGVLAIAGAILGYRPVLGLDHEIESVEACAENARVNHVQLEARRFDLRHDALPWIADEPSRTADDPTWIADEPSQAARPVMLANLLRPLLLELAATMPAAPAHLVASGLLVAEVDEVVEAFRTRLPLRERARRTGGEWGAVWLAAD
jgi:ribosomal protein L11 methyltransferase